LLRVVMPVESGEDKDSTWRGNEGIMSPALSVEPGANLRHAQLELEGGTNLVAVKVRPLGDLRRS
jgi:hypothetical protein